MVYLHEDQQGNTAPRKSEIIKMCYLNNKEEFSFLSTASLGFRLISSGHISRILPYHSLSANQCQQFHTTVSPLQKLALCSYYTVSFASSLCCSQWSTAKILENHSVGMFKTKTEALCSMSEEATTNGTQKRICLQNA